MSQTANFQLPLTNCIDQFIATSNNSTSATSYLWDFCQDGLKQTGVIRQVTDLSSASVPEGIELVYEKGNWYGFAFGRNSNSLYRLDFGTDLTTGTPNVVNLGNVGGLFSFPTQIEIVQEGSSWFGLVTNYNNSKIIRINFGSTITNTGTDITATDLGTIGGGSGPRGIDLVSYGSGWMAAVTYWNNSVLTMVQFSSTLANAPSANYTISNASNLNAPMGISLQQDNGTWFGIVANSGNGKIHHLNFGNNLMSDPVFTLLTTQSGVTDVALLRDGLRYFGFVETANGIAKIYFEESLTIDGSESVVAPNNFGGALSDLFGLSFGKDGANWRAVTIGQTNKQIHLIQFNDACTTSTVSINTSTATVPSGLSYPTAGTFYIDLIAYSATGASHAFGQTITIQNFRAPVIDFSTSNSCIANANTFVATTANLSQISTWSWDFGDGAVDNSNNPSVNHAYSTIGTKNVKLSILATNGCTNELQKTVNLFNAPIADFTLPPIPTCTNAELPFTNSSTYDIGSDTHWTWFINGVEVDDKKDLKYSFSSNQVQEIKLVASLTGCSDDAVHELTTLTIGPAVSFSYSNNCWGEEIIFTNSSSWSGTPSIQWDFDDGVVNTTDLSPTHLFNTPGTYQVKLTVTSNGCANDKTTQIIVSDDPITDFINPAPTENIPATFTGLDLTLDDDNITDWKWVLNNKEMVGNPSNLIFPSSGNVQVELNVKTSQGCDFTVSKNIVVNTALAPTVDFVVKTTACLNENIFITNNTVNAATYLWDFCQDGLERQGTIREVADLSSATSAIAVPEGVELINEKDNWYGFAFGRNNNTLYRLDFGSNLSTNTPSVVNLGNVGGLFNFPTQIEIVPENGNWIGLITNYGNSTITRLNFGNSLSNTGANLTATNIGTVGNGSGPRGLDLVPYGTGWVAAVTYWNNNTLTMINFANGLLNSPTGNFTLANNSSLDGPMGISLQNDNGKWFGLLANSGNGKIYHLDFGTNLLSAPVFAPVTTQVTPTDVCLIRDGLKYYGFIEAGNGIARIDFKEGLPIDGNETVAGANNFSDALTGLYGLSFGKDGTNWRALTISQTNNKIHLIRFDDLCSNGTVSPVTSTFESPPDLKFSKAGNYYIELTAYKSNGAFDYKGKAITVQNISAPTIDFSTNNTCLGSPNQFTAAATSSVNTYTWTFGDNSTDNTNSNIVSHQYSAIGLKAVTLSVASENGCFNTVKKTISIYNPPSAIFSLPQSPLCTNQSYTFTNTSASDLGSNPTWQWYIDDQPSAPDKDLIHSFALTTASKIKLVASIPGCSSTAEQTFGPLIQGPLVDFDVVGKCDQENIKFTSSITGTINSLNWTFGDNTSSTDTNPQKTFAGPGQYDVILSTTSPSGCANSATKKIRIYTNPQPSFTVDGAPNACTNVGTNFINTTPVPSDSDVSSWAWIFSIGNTSTVKDPVFTYTTAGSYNVSLKATTKEGCSTSIQQPVLILQSPTATITNTPGCVGVPVNFSVTGTNIDTYYWETGASYYTISNPTHTYNLPGFYDMQLTVTSANKCQLQTSKVLNVPAPLTPDFSITKNCIGYDAVLTDVTTGSDPVAQRDWQLTGLPSKNGATVSYNFSALGSQSVKLIVKGQSGCVYSRTKSIDVVAAPVADFSMDPGSGAVPLVTQFTNTSTGATSYRWKFDDAQNGSTQISPSFTFQNPADYTVELAASNPQGCENKTSKVVTAQVPNPDVAIKGITYSSNPDGSLKVIVTLSNSGNTILKNLPVDVDVSGITSLRETIPGPVKPATLYNLVLASTFTQPQSLAYFCAATTLDNDVVPTDNRLCKELEGKTSLLYSYPNPVKSSLHVAWLAPEGTPVSVRILDLFGKVHLESNLASGDGLNDYAWNVDAIESGLYVLQIQTATTKSTQRILIEH